MAYPIVTSLVTGIVNFFRPFLTNLFKGFFDKSMIGFTGLFLVIWDYIKIFFSRLPFYLLWLSTFYVVFRIFVEGAISLISSVTLVIPASVALGASWFLPENIPSLIALVYGSKLYRFVYDHKIMIMQARLHALVK